VPSLREVFAAIVAHAASTDVAEDRQYVAFPNFYYPLDADDLDLTKAPTAFAFALNMNMVPDEAPQFRLSDNFAWKPYQNLLSDRVLATAGESGSFARQFVDAQAQLGDGLIDPSSELPYFNTAVMPIDLADARAWTPVSLDAAAIRAEAQTLSPDHATWLGRFNLLGRLGEDFVDGVTLERLAVVVLRPWFNDAVFGWQFWDLPGTIVSDGAANPRGLLPGVISKLVLVRNLRVILAASTPPDGGPTVMFRRVGGAGDTAAPANRITELARFARETHKVDGSRAAFKTFRTSKASLSDRVKALNVAATGPSPADTAPAAGDTPAAQEGAQKFHVPFSFDVTKTRAHTAPLLTAAESTRQTRETELAALRREIERLTQLVANPPIVRDHRHGGGAAPGGGAGPIVRDHRHGGGAGGPVFNPFTIQLEKERAKLPAAEQALSQASLESMRYANSMSVIDQLGAIPAEPQAYVLACVCDRTPKSPNPDRALFV